MSEKYQELYALPENLYAAETPVLISAGKLYKNSESGELIVLLKMQNISENFRTIKAVKVLVSCFDVGGQAIAEKEYQYLDLSVKRGEEFGHKTPIYLTLPTVRAFTVKIAAVFWEDGTSWSKEDCEWSSLGTLTRIEDSLGEVLAAQYRRDTFTDAKYEVFAAEGIWVCACGVINQIGESSCCKCMSEKRNLVLALDHQTLAKNLATWREEQVALQKEKKEQAEKEETAKKKKVAVLLLAVVIVTALLLGIDMHNDRQKKVLIQDALIGTSWGYSKTISSTIASVSISLGRNLTFVDAENCTVRFVDDDEDLHLSYTISSISGNKARVTVGSTRYTIRYNIDGETCTIWEFSDENNLYKKSFAG